MNGKLWPPYKKQKPIKIVPPPYPLDQDPRPPIPIPPVKPQEGSKWKLFKSLC